MSDSKPIRSTSIVIAALAAVAVLFGLTLMRQVGDASRVERENARLAEENKALQDQLAKAGIEAPSPSPAATSETVKARNAAPETETTAQPDIAPAPAPPAPESVRMVSTTTGQAPEPRSVGLTLAGTHVAPVEGGLAANLRFNPNTTDPLGVVAVVVRIPKGGTAKILGFDAAGSMKFQGVSKTVSADGKFAMFEGTPEEVAAVELALSVSEPVVADVRGTCGIGPYQLEITSSGATAVNSN